MKRFFVITLVSSFTGIAFSQLKFEQEFRIQATEVPENAVNFVDSMPLESKTRWYKEAGYNKTSYEAKAKYKRQRMSIEFSENGSFEDIEIEIKHREIPLNTYKKIAVFFSATHDRYSIEKVQVQYSGNPPSVLNHFLSKRPSDIVQRYEIVLSAKIDGSYVLLEYLFDESGEFLQKSEVILKMTDNIVY
ncbi:MAG: hypothetical protein HC896_16820 [Bacteroidales bacterium]|nr:hypothetical protein [Bacteroidales bacterium]